MALDHVFSLSVQNHSTSALCCTVAISHCDRPTEIKVPRDLVLPNLNLRNFPEFEVFEIWSLFLIKFVLSSVLLKLSRLCASELWYLKA